jgi:hypothetical protein
MKNNYHITISKYSLILFLILQCGLSCKKWITVSAPSNVLVNSSVFSSDATATGAIIGIYSQMMQTVGTNKFPNGSPSVLYGMSADELVYYNGYSTDYNEFFNNNLTISNSEVDGFWNQIYSYIYLSNAIIEGLNAENGVSQTVKNQLSGEAKFIRAFCHFYLVNSFGDVPLVTSSDYRVNAVVSRSSESAVYQQIITDLLDAEILLSSDFSFSNGERLRPNKWTAAALLARVYLYLGKWEMAETESTSILNQPDIYSLASNLDSVFLKNSSESIWQLSPNVPYYNYSVQDAYFFIPYPETSPYVSISSSLLQSFELADKRKVQWLDSTIYQDVTYYFPIKYKQKFQVNTSEYYTVFRLAEQYLIRAEARAEELNLTGAIDDLNAIRGRAGLDNLSTSLTQVQILDTLAHERRIELFSEWGHRWMDLKRTLKADAVLSALKPGWQSTDTLYPIPRTEIQNDPQLKQNAGY